MFVVIAKQCKLRRKSVDSQQHKQIEAEHSTKRLAIQVAPVVQPAIVDQCQLVAAEKTESQHFQ